MIRFSSINRVDSKTHNPLYQRHHLIPRQAGSVPELDSVFRILSQSGFDLDDFRLNGVLLPCSEQEALRTGRPLHRGPHPLYNEVVIERMAKIYALAEDLDQNEQRFNFLSYRTSLLQKSLRQGLLGGRFQKLRLNRRDPMRSSRDFSQIDAHVDKLYDQTKRISSRCVQISLVRNIAN